MKELDIDDLNYGEILYEKSNAKSIYDAPSGKLSKKNLISRIFLIILALAILGWVIYCIILHTNELGFASALIKNLPSLFVLFVAETIILLTAFNAWGKFARSALQSKTLKSKHGIEGAEIRNLENELQIADANKTRECAIRIYEDYVTIINDGDKVSLTKSIIEQVQCDASSTGYKLTFICYDGTQIVAKVTLPFSDILVVKKHFDNFVYAPIKREKGYLLKKLSQVAMFFIPVIIGIALILLHCLVLPDMPIIFGIVFLSFGVLFIIIQFDDIPIVRHGIIPIGGGILLIGFPVGILLTIADLTKLSLITILTDFSVVSIFLGLFVGFGLMLIIFAIQGIIDCIKNKF